MPFEFKSSVDKWVKCISSTGTIRAVAISATEIANQMRLRHEASPASTVALTEATIAGLILSSYCKTGEKINLNIKGSGWCHQAIVDANADAEVRGYVIERPQDDVHLGSGIGPWGIGLLSVLRTKFDEAQPYIGSVPLLTGRLPKDLTFYWLQSEQVQSAVGIEVVIDQKGVVTFAQGFLIQALPGASETDIKFIETQIAKIQTSDLDSPQRSSPTNVLAYLMDQHPFSILEEKNLTYKCTCSRERVERALALTGTAELADMLRENKDVTVDCDFCSETYVFSPAMVGKILKENS
ncbi:MAG: Hsp33 family molecular chaperone HslO [Bdellovibrionales bacterium]|nr:Hsp33 family molecular chaperone HslO [Bdellovibrionales bacterium]